MDTRKAISLLILIALMIGAVFTPVTAKPASLRLSTRFHTIEKVQLSVPQAPNDTHTVCASGCDYSSIQDAIDDANDGDTIDLASETYTEAITIDKSINLIGDGIENTIVQAAGEPGIATASVITTQMGKTIAIENLTIRYGKTIIAERQKGGGGINNQALSLTISNTLIISNTAVFGGGILSYDAGPLVIINSNIEGNTATSYGGGIFAIYNDVSISQTSVSNNLLEGIYVDRSSSDLIATDSIIENNQGTGIHLDSNSDLAATGTTIKGNFGLGIFNGGGDLNIENCTIENNTNRGISNEGVLEIYNSQIISNTNRGIYNSSSGIADIFNTQINSNSGGGIYNSGSITLTQSTVSNNVTDDMGGGLKNRNNGTANLINCTISGNSATNQGGGIYNSASNHLSATNCTISNNSATSGGGIYQASDYIVLNSNIIANSSGGDCVEDYVNEEGIIYDDGYNLVEDGSCGFSMGGDPLLGPLQDNGGPTWTHALLSGSPAIDAIPTADCQAVADQRGVSRPQRSDCDIGSFELEPIIFSDHIFLPLVQR